MKKLLMTTCLGLALVAFTGCGEEKPATQGDGLIHTSKTKCESGKCESGKCSGATKETAKKASEKKEAVKKAPTKKCSASGKCSSKTHTINP